MNLWTQSWTVTVNVQNCDIWSFLLFSGWPLLWKTLRCWAFCSCQGNFRKLAFLQGMSEKTVVFKEENVFTSVIMVLITNLLHHSACVCTMSIYSNVHMACINVKTWFGVGSGRVGKCGMVRSATKSPGNVGGFYTAWRVVTLYSIKCLCGLAAKVFNLRLNDCGFETHRPHAVEHQPWASRWHFWPRRSHWSSGGIPGCGVRDRRQCAYRNSYSNMQSWAWAAAPFLQCLSPLSLLPSLRW